MANRLFRQLIGQKLKKKLKKKKTPLSLSGIASNVIAVSLARY